MEEEVSSDSISIHEDTIQIDHDKEQIRDVDNQIDEPKIGMNFDSLDELFVFYARYARDKGFAVRKRTSTKIEGVVRYVEYQCTRGGVTKSRSTNPLNVRPTEKIDCKAKLRAFLCPDEKWSVKSVELYHNHEMSPGKSRYFKCNRLLQTHVKKRLMLHDKAGIRVNKNFNSFVVEAGGHENLSFTEKDARNYINKVRRLQLGEGDANAMHNYFMKMQSNNSDFFYMMDSDEEGRLKNVFWADGRSRAVFKEFGDVVTFDTTYLVNKYDMPFAPFVGVNHHGQSVLLGCGLISSEDAETFTWLFNSWLTCMSNCPPNAIITDQDKAMKKAVEAVFPNARHRWCLWHILKKLPEKLKGYKEYESIKFWLQNVVYDSLTIEEFEDSWGKFIENYQLESNEWLLDLYDERHRWVPAFVKDIFWAGMSTTQQSEGMNAFFDGYINSKTTLKLFVEQYENALRHKVENEKQEDFSSYNSCYPCATPLGMEKQFQAVYTRSKFKEFQNELFGKLCCHLILIKADVGLKEYEVRERVQTKDGHRSATFKLVFYDNTKEVNCNCRLFEFRGIMCRHQLMVYNDMEIYDEVPAKYILQRWSKNVKRSHTKIRISYDNWSDRPEAQRFDKMCNIFYEVGELAADSETWCDEMIATLQQMKERYKEKTVICGSNMPILTNHTSNSTSHGDGIVRTKESTNILDPFVTRSKGRPPSKRKVGNVEKAVKKKAKPKKMTNTSTSAKDYAKHNNEHVTQESRMEIQSNFPFQPQNSGIGGSFDYYDFI